MGATRKGKNIWILNHYAVPSEELGGTRHFDIAKELQKRGHTVNVFASAFQASLGIYRMDHPQLSQEKVYDGVKFTWVKTRKYAGNGVGRVLNMLDFALNAFRVGRKSGSPDVIIASSVHPLTWLSGYFLAKRKKATFFSEVRDLWPETLIEMGAIGRKSLIARAMRTLERFIYRRSKKIISLLPGASVYIQTLNIPAERVVTIPNGVDVVKFDQNAEKHPYALPPELSNHFIAAYAGSHGPANYLELILEAARRVQDAGYAEIRFAFLGAGISKEKLRELANELELTNVVFLNPLPKDKVAGFLVECDTLLITVKDLSLYKYGISPNKMFDYFASSKPVIFSGNVYNDMVKEANAGFSVPAGDAASLAQAVIDCYHGTKEQREQWGQNGRCYVEENFSTTVLVDRLEQVLDVNG